MMCSKGESARVTATTQAASAAAAASPQSGPAPTRRPGLGTTNRTSTHHEPPQQTADTVASGGHTASQTHADVVPLGNPVHHDHHMVPAYGSGVPVTHFPSPFQPPMAWVPGHGWYWPPMHPASQPVTQWPLQVYGHSPQRFASTVDPFGPRVNDDMPDPTV
mmetsp:Transcript_53574/g.116404  ORF Transcript_53574/g.116404 Transcript_53574/m.116404 type:complete len:162 (+) Transcript_53574:2762-3247(+)